MDKADLDQKGSRLASGVLLCYDESAVFAIGDLHSPNRRPTKSFFASGRARSRLVEHRRFVFLRGVKQPLFFRPTHDNLCVTSGSFHILIRLWHSSLGGSRTAHVRRPIQPSPLNVLSQIASRRHHTRYHRLHGTACCVKISDPVDGPCHFLRRIEDAAACSEDVGGGCLERSEKR